MKLLTYTKALSIVEHFMEATQIRKFCTDICKGDCCGNCYSSDRACHKTDGRRLSCSAFLCHRLRCNLNPYCEYGESQFWMSYLDTIKAITTIMYEIGSDLNTSWILYNEYYSPFTKKMQRKFRIDRSALSFFTTPEYQWIAKKNLLCIHQDDASWFSITRRL